MSTDSDTIYHNNYSPQTIEHLLQQNEMKDIALNKATKLIQLLRIELQSQRKVNEGTINPEVYQNLKYQHSIEIDQLTTRIQLLERELERVNEQKLSSHKKIPRLKMNRKFSSHSLEHSNEKQRIASSRVITGSGEKSNHIPSPKNNQFIKGKLSLKDKLLGGLLIDIQQSDNALIMQLEDIARLETQKIQFYLQQFKQNNQNYIELNDKNINRNKWPNYPFKLQSENQNHQYSKYLQVIQHQQRIIVSMKEYQLKLQNQIQQIMEYISKSKQNEYNYNKIKQYQINIHKISNNIVRNFIKRIQHISKSQHPSILAIIEQNIQLKQIIQGFIQIYKKEERKMLEQKKNIEICYDYY